VEALVYGASFAGASFELVASVAGCAFFKRVTAGASVWTSFAQLRFIITKHPSRAYIKTESLILPETFIAIRTLQIRWS
jgi:hypothetical protein